MALQLQPVRAEETLALAGGCRQSGAKVRVHWPPDASPDAFAAWHRAVIASGFLPEVEIASEIETAAPDVALVHPQP